MSQGLPVHVTNLQADSGNDHITDLAVHTGVWNAITALGGSSTAVVKVTSKYLNDTVEQTLTLVAGQTITIKQITSIQRVSGSNILAAKQT